MRLGLLAMGAALICLLPYALTPGLAAWARPRQLILLSLLTLTGIASGAVLLLAAAAVPANLPVDAIPAAIGRCMDAAGQLFAHPLGHWPHILISIAVAALLLRLTYALAATIREVRRQQVLLRSLPTAPRSGGHPADGVRVVRSDIPFAYSIGLSRRQIIISDALSRYLPHDEYEAVLAHERAHIDGRHAYILFGGRVVARAFGFLPPVGRAVQQLRLGLEAAADEGACHRSGDSLVVAKALAALAGANAVPAQIGSALGAADSDLTVRIKRLTTYSGRRSSSRYGVAVVGLALVFVMLQVAALAAGATAMTASARTEEVHGICHLPHGSDHA